MKRKILKITVVLVAISVATAPVGAAVTFNHLWTSTTNSSPVESSYVIDDSNTATNGSLVVATGRNSESENRLIKYNTTGSEVWNISVLGMANQSGNIYSAMETNSVGHVYYGDVSNDVKKFRSSDGVQIQSTNVNSGIKHIDHNGSSGDELVGVAYGDEFALYDSTLTQKCSASPSTDVGYSISDVYGVAVIGNATDADVIVVGESSDSLFRYDENCNYQDDNFAAGPGNSFNDVTVNYTSGNFYFAKGTKVDKYSDIQTQLWSVDTGGNNVNAIDFDSERDWIYAGIANNSGEIQRISVDGTTSEQLDTSGIVDDATHGVSFDSGNQKLYAGYWSKSTSAFELPAEVTSLDVSIEGNTTVYNATGAQNFEVNATANFDDGTTLEVSENMDTTYSLDTTTYIRQLSPKDIWEGKNVGGPTNMTLTYTGPEGNVVTDSIDINVLDPLDSILLDVQGDTTGFLVNSEETRLFEVNAFLTFSNGTTEQVSSDSSTSYTFDANILNYLAPGNDFDDNFEALAIGQTDINATYQSEVNTSVSDGIPITVETEIDKVILLQNGSSEYFEASDDIFEVNATLVYKNGTVDDINLTAAYTFDSTILDQKLIANRFEPIGLGRTDMTADFTGQFGGTSTSGVLDVRIQRGFGTYNLATPLGQLFIILSDWAFLAIFASVALGGMVAIASTSGAGIATTTMSLSVAWVAGLVTIFIPASLILFEVFVLVVMDVQLVDFS